MKILLNATNLVVGGGIQVAASFIVEAVATRRALILAGTPRKIYSDF